jgi:hypothetical protein
MMSDDACIIMMMMMMYDHDHDDDHACMIMQPA